MLRRHGPVEHAGLCEVVVVIFSEVVLIDIAALLDRFGRLRMIFPVAVAVGLVVQFAAHVAVDAHQAVAVEAMRIFDAQGRVHRNLMMVHA